MTTMYRIRCVALLLIACFAPAATASAKVAAQLDQPFAIRVGEVATIAAEGLDVTFDAVLSDSRCPRGAQCIRAGEATVRITVRKPPAAADVLVLRTPSSADAAEYGGYRIRLTNVTPQPELGRQTRSEEYVATIVVAR
jgi:hypothetical protein